MKLDLTGGKEKKQYTEADLIPSGTQEARCIGVADLGTTDTFYEGAPTGKARFIRVFFECPDYQVKYKPFGQDEEIDGPRVIHQDFKVVGGDKSNLTKLFISWFGSSDNADTSRMVGRPAMVTVIHKTDAKGQVWANIGKGGIAMMPEKYVSTLAPQHNKDLSFSIDENGFDSEEYKRQWPSTKKKIAESYEFKKYESGPPQDPSKAHVEGSIPFNDENDLPY